MAINLNFERMGIDIKGDKAAEIATPMPVCKNMVDLFDFTDSNNKIWMDMYCKTGNTLEALKDRGVPAENIVAICPSKQSQLFACRKLYGQLLPEETVKIEIKSLNNYIITRRGKVYWISNWKDIVKNSSQDAYNLVEIVMKSEMENTMGKFEINNIVMNPPYNPSDLYIDSVELAHKIATDSVVAITPAKGINGKADAKNDEFREKIVPYISKAVLSRSGHDIFDVDENAGICYYMVDRDVHKVKMVKNICKDNIQLRSDFEEHDETSLNLYNRKILNIIGKVGTLGDGFKQSFYVKNTDHGEQTVAGTLGDGFKQSFYVKNTDHGEQTVAGTLGFKRQVYTGEQDRGTTKQNSGYVEVMQGEKVVGYRAVQDLFTTYKLDKYKCTCSCMMGYGAMFLGKDKILGSPYINIIGPNQVPKGSFPVLKYFDTLDEAKSFQSYIHSKLCSFLFFLGICGATITSQFFRYIPDPKVYDHIFTDQELYQKYNLTPDEINIIESVIKERKEK